MNRPYCIAEIGGNHEGDFAKALDLIKLAIDTPVDCIKFQTYFADTLVEKKAEQQSACSVHHVFDVGDVLQALEFEDQTDGYAGPQDPGAYHVE